MQLSRLLNACHHFPGFVYTTARLLEATSTIEVEVRPRRGSRPVCSCCGDKGPGYDVRPTRRFEFIPVWGYAVMLLYAMRRVQCRTCSVKVQEVPWAQGKHSLTKVCMLHLAHWARKLSWKETAPSFGTTWDQVCHAVEYVVRWGLAHRELGTLRAIGVDEIHIGTKSKFLTLVYQIAKHCTRALNILDRFHIVAKLSKALDEVRAGEARKIARLPALLQRAGTLRPFLRGVPAVDAFPFAL